MDHVFSSTTQLAAAIRAGKVSAEAVLEAHLAQIEQHNSALNAVVTLDVEGARRRAWRADHALKRDEVWGPLHGVPFTLKDAHATAGMRTTIGFPPMDHVPREDSTVVARLKAAGAILMGKTNVHELLGDALQSNNPIFGRTRNPWNPERTPGGSSGGAAAAVASGMTPFDIGSDLAGSLRIPADFCGLFGLKPTERRVSLTGFFPDPHPTPRSVRIMTCLGPLARSLEDLELLYAIIAGPDGQDTEVQPVPLDNVAVVKLKSLRIAVAPTFPDLPVSKDICTAIATLAQQLGRFGAVVEEALPEFDFASAGANVGELIGMVTGAFQAQKQPATLAHYLDLLDQRDQAIRIWEQFFEEWDMLLCPVSATSAIPHCEPGTPLTVDGQEITYWLGNAHCALFNYTGHPAIVLPYQQDRDGLPIGVQIVGKRWSEAQLLGSAKAIEQITGKFQRPAGY